MPGAANPWPDSPLGTLHVEPASTDWVRLLDRLHTFLAISINDTILHINPAGSALLGTTPSRLKGRSFFSIVHHDYSALAEVGLSIFAAEPGKTEMKLMRVDGGVVDVDLWVVRLGATCPDAYMIEAHDVTDHLRAASALRQREARLSGIINTVADGIVTLNESGVIQSVNPAAEAILGNGKSRMLGTSLRDYVIEEDLACRPDTGGWLNQLATPRRLQARRGDGGRITLEVSIGRLQDAGQTIFTAILRDVSARQAAEDRITHMAHHDALTGLPNRNLLGDRVEEALKRARRHGHKLALLFVDLDRFKPVNDTFGHATGDEVLKEVARRLKQSVRATDTVARVGGDEFTLLLEELVSGNEAIDVCRKIQRALGEPILSDGNVVRVSASIGVAVFPDHAETIAGLMCYADHQMYQAKSDHGRD